MDINPNIFRAYDIRGIYPDDINTKTGYLIGRAFVNFLIASKNLVRKRLNIVVGMDNRLSSRALKDSLIKGITDEGANVIDIGLSTTPMFYFSVAYYGYDGGVNITASHNPFQYNGFKIVRENAIPISGETGLRKIGKIASRIGRFKPRIKGKIIKKEILKDYVRFNLKEVVIDSLRTLKIVVDTANAVSGIIIPEFFKNIPIKIYYLFQKLDGRFPNHSPNPLIKENLRWLQEEVKRKKADFGIALDGDGDRICFVDEQGKSISGDLITALLASFILEENPGVKILYDIRSSRVVKEVIEKNGGVPVVGRVGHSFIKRKMRKENIFFAGELSGHYYYKRNFFCEDPFFVLFSILEKVSETKKKLSEFIRPFEKYFYSGEINFRVKKRKEILRELERQYNKGKISRLDGFRVDFENWWFLVRPSNTEPVLRLVIEAKTKELMDKKKKEIAKIIQAPFFS